MARRISVEIVGDASSLKRAFNDASDHSSRFGSALGGMAKAGALAAGTAGLGGLFITMKAGISEFSQAQKVTAQTNAVIKSTGGAANITAGQVDKLATAVMNYSGMDDEAVKSGENMLLTFTNIRNRVGKNNDIFTQATKATADMATAMGMDMPKAALQLGKALNDPEKGMTRLQRIGVTFTDAQKKQVAAMVEVGNTAGAQRVILAELTKEFGGSAKAAGDTLPGQLNKLKESFNNMAGNLVEKAVPALTRFTDWINGIGLPAIQKWAGIMSDKLKPVFAQIGETVQQWWPRIQSLIKTVADLIQTYVWPVFQKLGTIAVAAIRNIAQVVGEHGPQLKQMFTTIGQAIEAVGKIAIPILRFALVEVLPRAIGIAITAITLIVGALKGIATGINTVVGWFRDMPGRIAAAITAGIGAVKKAITGLFGNVIGWVKDVLGIGSPSKVFEEMGRNTIQGFIKGVGSMAGVLASAVKKMVTGLIPTGGGGLLDRAVGAGHAPYAHGLSSQVNRALTYARQHGWHGSVISGFRTRAEQEALYARYVASGFDNRYIAARPGTSSHESGNAVDVSDAGTFDRIMASAPAYARLMNNVPGDFGHFSVSGRALGGPVNAGTAYMVGEQGREMFVPSQNGTIISNTALRGSLTDLNRSGTLLGTSFLRGVYSKITPSVIQGPIAAAKAAADDFVEGTGVDNMTGAGELLGTSFVKGLNNGLGSIAGGTPAGLSARGLLGAAGLDATAPGGLHGTMTPGQYAPVVNVTVNGSVMTERDLAIAVRDQIVAGGTRSGGGMLRGQA